VITAEKARAQIEAAIKNHRADLAALISTAQRKDKKTFVKAYLPHWKRLRKRVGNDITKRDAAVILSEGWEVVQEQTKDGRLS
jgi:hypothetical protein